MSKKLRLGTRKSELAMIQTRWVEAELKKLDPQLDIEIVPMSTTGDKILDVALSKIGEKSLFTKELERALETDAVDLVVHSLKDLPTTLPAGMCIGAVCPRENPADAVVMRAGRPERRLAELPAGSVVGTSSLRRTAQLQRRHPQLQFHSVRGNLNTRLRKLDAGGGEADFAAIVLAVAGVSRMGWAARISAELAADECLHAAGQGALAVECRAGDAAVLQLVSALSERAALLACVSERALLRQLEGGCSVPVAAHGQLSGDAAQLQLTAGVWSLDGAEELRRTATVVLPAAGQEQARSPSDAAAPAQPDAERSASSQPQPKRRKLSDGERHFVGVWVRPELRAAAAAAQQLGVIVADKLLALGARRILTEARAANDAGAAHDPSRPPTAAAADHGRGEKNGAAAADHGRGDKNGAGDGDGAARAERDSNNGQPAAADGAESHAAAV